MTQTLPPKPDLLDKIEVALDETDRSLLVLLFCECIAVGSAVGTVATAVFGPIFSLLATITLMIAFVVLAWHLKRNRSSFNEFNRDLDD